MKISLESTESQASPATSPHHGDTSGETPVELRSRALEGRIFGLLLLHGTPRVDVSTRPYANVAGTLLPQE